MGNLTLLDTIINLLPRSPFTGFIDSVKNFEYLGYINYFIPIGLMVSLGIVWTSAIGVYYIYSIILRWVKAIK